MVNANLDNLELELRKLDGVRSVGFSPQNDILYIQLFIEENAPSAQLPFQATRIAQHHSELSVAVELVRYNPVNEQVEQPQGSGLGSIFADTSVLETDEEEPDTFKAGSIRRRLVETDTQTPSHVFHEEHDESLDIRDEPTDFFDMSAGSEHDEHNESAIEQELGTLDDGEVVESTPIILEDEHTSNENAIDIDRRQDDHDSERITLLLVTTSPDNDEIEVHLTLNDTRTIGRAPTNRGLLGAIDATVSAISELSGISDFHAEWARSLEPGAEHASLVAIGLTNDEATDTRHGIAGGSSPIEAAARATLNALNRTAALLSNNS